MFKKVSTEEIKDIKVRLETELKEKSFSLQRKEEVNELLYFLNIWLEWKTDRDRDQEHYREVIKSES